MKRQVWAALTRVSSKLRAFLIRLHDVSLQHLELCPRRPCCGLAVRSHGSPAPVRFLPCEPLRVLSPAQALGIRAHLRA